MFLTRSMYRPNYFWRNQNIWYFNLINLRNLAVNKNINRILRKRSIWTVLIFYDQIWEGKHLKLRWNLMRKLNGNLVWKLYGIFKIYDHNIFQNFVLVKRLNCFKTTSMTIKCLQCRDIFVKCILLSTCILIEKLRFI